LVVLLVVVASGAFKIRWPTSHAIVLLLFTFAPIIVGALAGITVAPSARRWVEAIQLAIQTDRDSRVGTDDRSTLTIHVSRGFTSIYAVLGLAMTGAALFDAMVVASPMSSALLSAGSAWSSLEWLHSCSLCKSPWR